MSGQFLQTKTLPELRKEATGLGITGTEKMDRAVVTTKIIGKWKEIEGLRNKCAGLGLSVEGTESDLRLRLTVNDPNSLTQRDHQTYSVSALAFAGLGVAALLVSLPHLTIELSRITGLHWTWAALLALVIDGGIIAAKVVDTLKCKFSLGKVGLYNTVAQYVCLGLSAAINASGFLAAESANPFLAVAFACVISGFVWFSFNTSAYLFTRKAKAEPKEDKPVEEPKKEPELTPADKLRAAADQLDHLNKIAKQVKL